MFSENKLRFQVSLTREMFDELENFAEGIGVSKSDAISFILGEYISSKRRTEKLIIEELKKELSELKFGSVT